MENRFSRLVKKIVEKVEDLTAPFLSLPKKRQDEIRNHKDVITAWIKITGQTDTDLAEIINQADSNPETQGLSLLEIIEAESKEMSQKADDFVTTATSHSTPIPQPTTTKSAIRGFSPLLVPDIKEEEIELDPIIPQREYPTTTQEISPQYDALSIEEIIANIDDIVTKYEQIKNDESDRAAINFLSMIGLGPKLYGIFRVAHIKYKASRPADIVVTKEAVEQHNQGETDPSSSSSDKSGGALILGKIVGEISAAITNNDRLTLFDHPEASQLSAFNRLSNIIAGYLDLLLSREDDDDHAIPHQVYDAFNLLIALTMQREMDILSSGDEMLYADPIFLSNTAEAELTQQLEAQNDLHRTSHIHHGNTSIFCMSSEEAIDGGMRGQDSIGIAQYADHNGHIRTNITGTDGVGSSVLGEILARALVKVEIAFAPILGAYANPELNTTRLQLILSKILPDIHAKLPGIVEDYNLIPMLKTALLQGIENDGGSSSMKLTLDIRDDGQVRGNFIGDGGVILIRKGGDPNYYDTGDHKSRLSTGRGLEGAENITYITDLVGDGITLQPGDAILVHSDGIQRGKQSENGSVYQVQVDIVAVVQQFQNGGISLDERDTRIADILTRTDYYTSDDDRNLGLYVQPDKS